MILIAASGLVLRAAYPSRMAVEHFDEGVYASNVWFGGEEGFRYPSRHLYAPPLLPFLLEWCIALFGPGAAGTMLIGILCGAATVAMIWWVGRQWFGAEAGIASATLAAFSDFHLLYSRTALTDVLLSLLLLTAVYCTWEAFRKLQFRWVTAAGIITGLAWWTKYNGWLPLAVGLSGGAAWVLVHRSSLLQKCSIGKVFGVWLGIAVTAVVVWSPVWFELQDLGGYRVVSENHRRYFAGLDGWVESFTRQLGNHRLLEGWLTFLSPGLAAILAWTVAALIRKNFFTWNGNASGTSSKTEEATREYLRKGVTQRLAVWVFMLSTAALLSAVFALLGSSLVLGGLALAGFGIPLWQGWRKQSDAGHAGPKSGPAADLIPACWLLAAWFTGLLLATPFYRPYPRLTLPWLPAVWLGAGAAIGWGINRLQQLDWKAGPDRSPRGRWWLAAVATPTLAASIPLLLQAEARLTSRGVPGWQNRTGLKVISEQIVQEITDRHPAKAGRPGDADFVIVVYGEPALVFHLNAEDARRAETQFVVQPIGHLNLTELPGIPVYLVTGPHAQRDSTLSEQLLQMQSAGKLEHVAEYPFYPSVLVLLNHYPPDALADAVNRPRESIHVFRVR